MSKAKSISSRLLQIARLHQVSHQTLLIRFFYERLLCRVSLSSYKNNLWLKGGNLLYAIQGVEARPTVDIDFLGKHLTNEAEKLKTVFKEILAIDAKDELVFDTENISAIVINEQNSYTGIRIKVKARLGNIEQSLQIDVGYGDKVTPKPLLLEYPLLLDDFEPPLINAYTPETVIAEKLQAIITLAQLNSRMKDFYDIYTLLTTQQMDKTILKEAITQTFTQRNTPISFDSVVFTSEFYTDSTRLKMWKAFLRKIKVAPIDFEEVIKRIKKEIPE